LWPGDFLEGFHIWHHEHLLSGSEMDARGVTFPNAPRRPES
jgi:hypothetical protein